MSNQPCIPRISDVMEVGIFVLFLILEELIGYIILSFLYSTAFNNFSWSFASTFVEEIELLILPFF
jgi:hypothetical protein